MSSQRRATIVVNNHNYGRYLRAAIDSALAQTYRPIDLIVVDDGSTDNSREIIASYEDRVVPVLKENGGQASAFNAGFQKSKGEFVLFLDSDDLLLPTAIEKAAEILRDADVAKVHWPLLQISADDGLAVDGVIPRIPLPDGNLREKLTQNGPYADPGVPTSGNVWSASFLRRVMPMPANDLRYHADAYLHTLAGIYGRVRLVPEPQGYYRVHGQNVFAALAAIDRLRRNRKMYHYRCQLLSEHLARVGTIVDPDAWKKGNFHYEWLAGRIEIAELVEDLVAEGESYIFVDDGAWGNGELIPGRRRVVFPDSKTDDGYPLNDAAAITEFEELRKRESPELMVFIDSSLWWFDAYPEFGEHLRSTYRLISENQHGIGYQLTAAP